MADHVRRLTNAAAICALAFVTLLVIVATGRPRIDEAVAEFTAAHRTELGVDIADGISVAGSVVGIIPLGLLFAFLFWRKQKWTPVKWMVIASAGATTLYLVVNVIMRSARPPMPLRVYDDVGWSFPSGHSTQAIVFWPINAILTGRRWVLIPAVLIALTIASSRIYLDVHWTTDVMSGLLLGLAWLFTVLAVRART
ncbi:MAG: phosphatase PAP2 family protein [Kofleriaceae bacterium]